MNSLVSIVVLFTGTATTSGAKAYTLAEVTAATSNFKDELGKGGFGPVYYGKLPDGQEVAVKVGKGTSTHEEEAFFTEVYLSTPPCIRFL